MHDLLEGYVLKLMLTEFITVRKYFKLAELSENITQFKYELTKSKLRLLSMSALSIDESKTILKMSGMYIKSRMLQLLHIVPDFSSNSLLHSVASA